MLYIATKVKVRNFEFNIREINAVEDCTRKQ